MERCWLDRSTSLGEFNAGLHEQLRGTDLSLTYQQALWKNLGGKSRWSAAEHLLGVLLPRHAAARRLARVRDHLACLEMLVEAGCAIDEPAPGSGAPVRILIIARDSQAALHH